ncbi:MAG: DUF1631 family protein [Pseudomonadota bacterium]|nr:DUF1631 family protein [Pseudomonadota bacterium]
MMQERAPSSEVIPLRPPVVNRTGGAALIAKAFDDEFFKALFASLDATLQATDDYLFNLADKAGSSAQQNTHFDSMRALRLHRQSINGLFSTRIQTSFEQLYAGKLPQARRADGSLARDSRLELSLVEHDTLEENLAVISLVDRCVAAFTRPLHTLQQRMTHALGLQGLDENNNPAAPQQLAASVVHAITPTEMPVDVRLICLKHLERQWLSVLGPLYERANRILAESGVLPELRYTVARSNAPAARPRAPGGAAAPGAQSHDHQSPQSHDPGHAHGGSDYGGAGGGYYAGGGDYGGIDPGLAPVVSELMRLLGGGGDAAGGGMGAPGGAGPGYSGSAHSGGGGYSPGPAIDGHALMNALSMLQAEQMGSAGGPAISAEQAKAALIARARGLVGGGTNSRLRNNDETALDLVGMLFDYAIQDRNLPGELQSMLSRLQIPYLKVALLDPTFVARKDHPARALLDDLAAAALGWSEDSDKDRSFFHALESLVRSVISSFDQDLGVFDVARKQLSEAIATHRKRSDIAEKRTTEAARGKERLEQAQQESARELLRRVEGKQLPARLRDMLTKRWSNYLVMTHLRNGGDSAQWKDALRVVEVLADAPSRLENDPDDAGAMLEVEQILKRGLTAVGIHGDDVDELWSGISELLTAQHQGGVTAAGPQSTGQKLTATAAPVRVPPTRAPGQLQVPPTATLNAINATSARPGGAEQYAKHEQDFFESLEVRFGSGKDEVVYSPETVAKAAEPKLPPAVAGDSVTTTVRDLKPGAWLEFVREDATRERAKLLWVSTVRSQYLFVNRNGVKCGEYAADDLVKAIRGGKLQVLEESGLVDRALNAIVRKLRRDKPNT